MKRIARLFALIALSPLALAVDPAPEIEGVTGRYIEARTASVFAGACHYGAEYTTAGREAALAWNLESGTVDGVSLAGATVVVAVAANTNLASEEGRRRSVIFLPRGMNAARRGALLTWVTAQHGDLLGDVLAIRDAELSFVAKGDAFDVRVGEELRISGELMQDRACCSMPHKVWYRPLWECVAAKPIVGGVDRFRCKSAELGRAWDLRNANCVFYAPFGVPIPTRS